MTGPHATATELERFVMGALDPARIPLLVRHAAACEVCGAALAREARLEVAFEQLAERAGGVHDETPRAPVGQDDDHFEHSWKATRCGVFGVLAMAAATLLWLGRPTNSAAGDGPTAGPRGAMGDGAVEAKADVRDGG